MEDFFGSHNVNAVTTTPVKVRLPDQAQQGMHLGGRPVSQSVSSDVFY